MGQELMEYGKIMCRNVCFGTFFMQGKMKMSFTLLSVRIRKGKCKNAHIYTIFQGETIENA